MHGSNGRSKRVRVLVNGWRKLYLFKASKGILGMCNCRGRGGDAVDLLQLELKNGDLVGSSVRNRIWIAF